MAATLSVGPRAFLSHRSAAELWELTGDRGGWVHVSVSSGEPRSRKGIVLHRRSAVRPREVTRRHGIPVLTTASALVDLAAVAGRPELEAAVNEADKRGLTDPERLRAELGSLSRRPGLGALRVLLDRATFRLTESELERIFLPVARAAGLEPPETQRRVNGFRVDFFWPRLGLVVEVDGLRYHRTAAQQQRDRARDQAHAAAGLTPLRFTHGQVRFDAEHCRRTLERVAQRLATRPPG